MSYKQTTTITRMSQGRTSSNITCLLSLVGTATCTAHWWASSDTANCRQVWHWERDSSKECVGHASSPLSLSFSFAAVTFYGPISFPPLTNCSHHILFQDGTSQTAEKREMSCTRRWKATLEGTVLSKEQRSHPFCPSSARALCNTSSNL